MGRITLPLPDLYYARRKTAKEPANKMLSLGCTHAINLDGGGSSQVADSTGVYSPADMCRAFFVSG